MAFYQLDCKCKLCLEHGKDLNINIIKLEKDNKENKENINNKEINNNNNNDENINNKKDICPVCKKEIINGKQIAFTCDICFEVTSKLFHFLCGCAMEVCKMCYNKIIETKICPGCRKNIFINEK